MFKKVLFSIFILSMAFACSKKQKPDDVLPEAGPAATQVDDGKVQGKDMGLDAKGSDSGKINGLHSLHFEYDKATLTSESRTLAQKNVTWMKNNPGTSLQIEGHCDQHGSIEYNLALGERRAKAVKTYMVNLGADKKRMSVISYGKEKLLDSSGSESADGKNRRANFVPQDK